MSELTSADLINACLKEIDSWDELPRENHINESGMIDLDYAHILLVYTLKNAHILLGADKADLVTDIIAQLDYWTSATPYKDWSDFEGVEFYQMTRWHKNCFIEGTRFRNTEAGWRELAHAVLDGKVSKAQCRFICQWNDKNGAWGDLNESGYFTVDVRECVSQVLQWGMGFDL